MREDRERLNDILESIDRIERYSVQGRYVFEEDELIQTWFIRHLEVIGEACRAMSSELQAAHPEVPWVKIIGMRNILTHNYFEIDLDVVWFAVESDLPDLKQKVLAILQSFPPD
jgi:uncharacterized protein with HEPN domain